MKEAEPTIIRESYLKLLQHLLSKKERLLPHINDFAIKMIDKTAFALYLECKSLGAEEPAKDILKNFQNQNSVMYQPIQKSGK